MGICVTAEAIVPTSAAFIEVNCQPGFGLLFREKKDNLLRRDICGISC